MPSHSTLRVYKTKSFSRFARKAQIPDSDLFKSARLVGEGFADADLGGGVFKQRIARAGKGKSGGSRVILVFRFQARIVFVFGFEKKDITNITVQELEAFRELADIILGYSEVEVAKRVADGALLEIKPPEEQFDGS